MFSIQEGKQQGVNLKLLFSLHLPKSRSKIVCVCFCYCLCSCCVFSILEGKQHGVNLKLLFTYHLPKSKSKIVCVCVVCFLYPKGKQHTANLKLLFTLHLPNSNSKVVCVCVKNDGSSLLVLQTEEITYFIMNKLKYLLHLICLPPAHYTTPSSNMIIFCLDLETTCHPRGSC